MTARRWPTAVRMQFLYKNFAWIILPSTFLPRRLESLGIDYQAHSHNKKINSKWDLIFIIIGRKSIFYRQWYNAGVKTLSDILDEGNLLSFPECRKKYKMKNFLRYFGLCNAIPKYWKEAFNRDLENESVTTGQSATHPLNISFWTCQHAHSLYVSKTFQIHTSKARPRPVLLIRASRRYTFSRLKSPKT